MSWIAENWSDIAAVVSSTWGAYQTYKHRKAKKRADRLAKELQAIRVEAGMQAPWEIPLGEQSRRLRASRKAP